eukprot:TRINITY_DN4005_c0_g1_i1.p1 TRINITY_DN4005_c0_g1~~TRINITY_DN4005_c0_g1_i1.p1  ORF type:complete len:109 (-),score=11.80 TRINITY_DN4005_c0_g1_i1:593-919(-)
MDHQLSQALESTYLNGTERCQVRIKNVCYEYDFSEMTQKNMTSQANMTRKIRRNEPPSRDERPNNPFHAGRRPIRERRRSEPQPQQVFRRRKSLFRTKFARHVWPSHY